MTPTKAQHTYARVPACMGAYMHACMYRHASTYAYMLPTKATYHGSADHAEGERGARRVLREGEGLLHEGHLLRANDVRQPRELAVEVGITSRAYERLLGPFAVARIDGGKHIHAVDHAAKRHHALHVERLIVVVVDEDLRATRARTSGRKGDRASHVPVRVLDVRFVAQRAARVPFALAREIAVQPELDDEAGHDAEETAAVEEARGDQLEEASCSNGRLLLADRDREVTGTVLELDEEAHRVIISTGRHDQGDEGEEPGRAPSAVHVCDDA